MTLIRDVLERISNACFERTYSKPRYWFMGVGLAGAAVLGSVSGFFVFKQVHDTELEKAAIQASAEIKKTRMELDNCYKEAIAKVRGPQGDAEIVRLKEKVKNLESQAAQAEKRNSDLESQLAQEREDIAKYRENHPEGLTQEKYSGLESQLTQAQQDLEKYKEAHPEELTQDDYSELQGQLETARRALEDYKKNNPVAADLERQLEDKKKELETASNAFAEYKKTHTNQDSDYIALQKKKDSLESEVRNLKEIIRKIQPSTAGINIEWAGRVIGYHTDFEQGYLYFNIPYEIGDTEKDLKILGSYIPKDVAEKYSALQTFLGKAVPSDDYDRLRIKWRIRDGEYQYTLTGELNGKESFEHYVNINKSQILEFLKSILLDDGK